jgi:predicted RecB family nuclease
MVRKVSPVPPSAIRELSRIPGVGPSIAANLYRIGIRQVADLRGRDPERLYAALCRAEGQRVDRCALYVFRCAVYFASESRHDPELLKWWNWKDGRGAVTGGAGR